MWPTRRLSRLIRRIGLWYQLGYGMVRILLIGSITTSVMMQPISLRLGKFLQFHALDLISQHHDAP